MGLWILYGFTAVALLGYASFGLHPELLARVPAAAGFYGVSFRFFSVGQVWLAFGVFVVFLWRRVGWQWLGAFAVLYGISLASELMGTSYGVPFGEYRYGEVLAPMWGGRVPVVIPLSWFYMAVPAYALASWALGASGRVWARIGLGSLVLLAWDLSLDPAMSHATQYWIWGSEGAYYGMPWSNLVGWYVTGLVLMGALVGLRADRWLGELPLSWLMAFYGANLLLPVGMSVAAGLWGAVWSTLVVLGGVWLVVRALRSSAPESPRSASVLTGSGSRP